GATSRNAGDGELESRAEAVHLRAAQPYRALGRKRLGGWRKRERRRRGGGSGSAPPNQRATRPDHRAMIAKARGRRCGWRARPMQLARETRLASASHNGVPVVNRRGGIQ